MWLEIPYHYVCGKNLFPNSYPGTTTAARFSFCFFLDSILETSAWIKTRSASRELASGCGSQSCLLEVDTNRNNYMRPPSPPPHNPVGFWHSAGWNVMNEWLEHLLVIRKLRNPCELTPSGSMHGLPVVQLKFSVQTCVLINIMHTDMLINTKMHLRLWQIKYNWQ